MSNPSSNLEDVKNEAFDLYNIHVEDVFEALKCSCEGLTSDEAAHRLAFFGPNKLPEKKESELLKFLGCMWNPLSWVIVAAAIMAIALAKWQDFVGVMCLLVIHSTISFIEETKAANAAAALMANLSPKCKVLRDNQWEESEAALLVPGDIISIKSGDIVPADARLLEGGLIKVDQSALINESRPLITKGRGDGVFSGETCKQGEIEAVVIATGVYTVFGKAGRALSLTRNSNPKKLSCS